MDWLETGDEQRLWDELDGFGMDRLDLASDHLMAALCRLGQAQSASWVSGVRLAAHPEDALQGWRVVHYRPFNWNPAQQAAVHRIERRWEERKVDPSFLLAVENTGKHRAYTFRDRLPEAWFSSPYYQQQFAAAGIYDVAVVCVPVNRDTEIHYLFHRKESTRAFDAAELERLAYFPRRLGRFHRNLLLSFGVLLASSPLTPVERRVLNGLLGPGSEKQIAGECGMTISTTHQYVVAIYRKFGVSGRPELMNLWLS